MLYDELIVGGGSSGSVLAARLSEDSNRNVILLEAGPAYNSMQEMPNDLLDAKAPALSNFDWGYTASTSGKSSGGKKIMTATRAIKSVSIRDGVGMVKSKMLGSGKTRPELAKMPYFMGKVIGGSSAINGAVAIRGLSADYDEWRDGGHTRWGWSDVLPYFKKLETDTDVHNEFHGSKGPITITRPKNEELIPLQKAFFDSCKELCWPVTNDHNDPVSTGVGPVPLNAKDGVRVSSALGYLLPLRDRKNLTVRGGCLVNRVLFQGKRAIGVEFIRNGRIECLFANRITLCGGAVHSPSILFRSGIGNPVDLNKMGIEIVADVPGVGQNLLDHPAIVLWAIPRPRVCIGNQPYHQMFARFTSDGSKIENDMQLFMLSDVDVTLLPLSSMMGVKRAFAISAILSCPRSSGSLTFSSVDPHNQPLINLNCLSEQEDTRRLVQGARVAWSVLHSEHFKKFVDRLFIWNEKIINSDALISSVIKTFVTTSFHPAGTARIGKDSDKKAVVDQHCTVREVRNLSVVDASVIPKLPRAPINLTCMMLGEKMADYMRNFD
ncbi:MAG: GMC family oxidoreductase N-terminal domain-containing protein [Myxococcota bacterium]|nr:GMC family oxidoreductase N-terminal domain-containing protein [Myxococcota bacterium]